MTFDEIQIGDHIGIDRNESSKVLFKAKILNHVLDGSIRTRFEIILMERSDSTIWETNVTLLNTVGAKIQQKNTKSAQVNQIVCNCDILAIWRGESHKCGFRQ